MTKKIGTSIFLLICTACAGCIGLTHQTAVAHYGIDARIIDKDSRIPFPKVPVLAVLDGREQDISSNPEGRIEVPSEVTGYWTWLGGPVPMLERAKQATCELRVSGYETYRATFVPQGSGASTNEASRPVQNYRLQLGDIELKKHETPPTKLTNKQGAASVYRPKQRLRSRITANHRLTAKCRQAHNMAMKAKGKTHVLTVREVPDVVYRTLRDRAVTNRRSLQQEVRQKWRMSCTGYAWAEA